MYYQLLFIVILSFVKIIRCSEANETLLVPLLPFTNTTGIGLDTLAPNITRGHLTHGVPKHVMAAMPGANLTFLNSVDYTDIEIDYDGVSQFVDMLNGRLSKNSLKRRDGSTTSFTLDEMLELVEYTVGIKSNRFSKREDCSGDYWHNFTNTLFDLITCKDRHLLARWKQFAWTTATWFLSHAAGWSPFAYSIAEGIKNRSTKKACAGGFEWLNYKKGDKEMTYWVGYAPYTIGNNCERISCNDILELVMEYSLDSVNKTKIAGFCSSFTHKCTCRIDVRIMQWDEKYSSALNGWDIPCER